jgi:protease-4
MATPRVLRLDLTRPLVDSRPTDLLGAVQTRRRPVFAEVVSAIRRVATEARLTGLVARVGGSAPSLGPAHVQELRDAVLAVRAAGKPTIGFAETFGEFGPGTVGYAIGAAFEELWLQPSGDVGLTGISVQTAFVREAVDRLGLQPRIGQRREYKNAPDTVLRDGYSDPHREALDRVVTALTDQLLTGIAADRGVEPAVVRAAVDRAPVGPADAVRVGLVDRLGYRDEVVARLAERFGDDAVYVDPAGTRVGPGVPGAAAAAAAQFRDRGRPVIAVVQALGGIRTGRSGRSALSGASVGSDTLGHALRAAGRDDAVAAVVLRVDSPGGSYLASDTVLREVLAVRRAGTPVVVSMGEYAASGGYFIAMGADRIVAQPGTLTGSIGVFGGKIVTRQLFERYGVRRDAVAVGPRARMFSPAFDYTDDEWAMVDGWLDRVYEDFSGKVAEHRGLSPDHVQDIARGRVWVGADAAERGLVDELGGLQTAVEAAARLAGLDPDRVSLRRTPTAGLVGRLRQAVAGPDKHDPVPTARVDGGLAGVVGGLLADLVAGVPAASGLPELADAVAMLLPGTGGALLSLDRVAR